MVEVKLEGNERRFVIGLLQIQLHSVEDNNNRCKLMNEKEGTSFAQSFFNRDAEIKFIKKVMSKLGGHTKDVEEK